MNLGDMKKALEKLSGSCDDSLNVTICARYDDGVERDGTTGYVWYLNIKEIDCFIDTAGCGAQVIGIVSEEEIVIGSLLALESNLDKKATMSPENELKRELNDYFIGKAQKEDPNGKVCGFCGAMNDNADDIGWLYVIDVREGEIRKENGILINPFLPCCLKCKKTYLPIHQKILRCW